MLVNKVAKYKMSTVVEEKFDEEIGKWLAVGWLKPCEPPDQHGIIPLMAVEQKNKGKVHPVLNFSELNNFDESYTGNSDIRSKTIWTWHKIQGKPDVLI